MSTCLQTGASVSDILERVLDKGIVIDASVRVSVAGVDLVAVDARVVVASLQTYLHYVRAFREDESRGERSRRARAPVDPASLEVVRQAFEAWNSHDVERYVRLLDPAYVSETHGLPTLHGPQAASEAMSTYFRVLPDFHFSIQNAIVTGGDVLVSWVATGTPRDEYNGATLTPNPLQVPGCTVTRLRHRKIVHTWNYWDTPTFAG